MMAGVITLQDLTMFLGNETYAETGELKIDSSDIVRVIGQAYKVWYWHKVWYCL